MRLGSKQIMNADAFHEPTWISDGQPGVIHQHTHAAKYGVVPVSKRIDQGFPERPLIEFRHHRRKQSYIQFRPRIPWFKRFRYLFYGFEQRSTICLIHPDIGAYKHLENCFIRWDKAPQRLLAADKQQTGQSRRHTTIHRYGKPQGLLQILILKFQKITIAGLV